MADNSALLYCPSEYLDCNPDLPDMPAAGCRQVGVDLYDTFLIAEADSPGFTNTEWATDGAFATALAARLAQTGSKTVSGFTGNAAIRAWQTFDATKPLSEPTFVTAFGGLRFAKKSEKTFEGFDYDNSIENHNWHDKMNCTKQIKVLPLAGSYLYGPQQLLIVSFSSWHGVIDNNDKPAEGFQWRLSWNAVRELPKRYRPASV